MYRILLMIIFAITLVWPALAQKAEIEALNSRFIEAFNRGILQGLLPSTPKMRLCCRQELPWCMAQPR